MDSRERVGLVMSGAVPDRVPIQDGFWRTTVERWRSEGLPDDVSPEDYFGTDEIVRVGGDCSMQFVERVVEETERSRTVWGPNGALNRLLQTPGGERPQWLDYTIKSPDDWLKHRHRMGYNDSRITESALETYRQGREKGRFIVYSVSGSFHVTWGKIGMETLLVWMLEDPSLVSDMFAAHAQLCTEVYDGMRRRDLEFDGAFVGDDLGYKSSSLISPALYRELVYPHHKRLCDHFANDGLTTILHSDGNVNGLIPDFLDAGFDALNPLEVKAMPDVRDLKREYGKRLVLYGGIDVRKLSGTREDIEEEIGSKVSVAKEGGGYIFASDHSVPHSVSFDNFCFAMEMLERHGSYD